jgi:ribonucleoside-triphosphate reductase
MPNLIYNIDGADLNEWLDVFELSAKFSSPYFCHYHKNNVEYQTTLGCRSALPANWTEDPNIDCMGLGNSVYTTVSLPAIALKTVEEDGNFYDNLKYYMGLVREYNLNRLDWIKKLWFEYHTADFMIQEMPDGRPLYDLDNATIVLGYLGLSEALEILGYGDITEDNTEQARFIMCFMADEIAKWKEEDGLRWGLFQTPAENLAYKNAQKMVRKYGFKRSHAKGTATRPFYTNSNHVPVDSDINLIDRIRLEGNNQPFGPAGNIMNVYLGESYSEASALKSLCEKIRDNTDAYFWAFSSAYSICPECNSKFKGAITKCPFDGAETDVYDRVTGYLTNTKTWNPGKREEFIRRHRY